MLFLHLYHSRSRLGVAEPLETRPKVADGSVSLLRLKLLDIEILSRS